MGWHSMDNQTGRSGSNILDRQNKRDREIVHHIIEYLKVMESEPAESLIRLRSVYHDIRRILGDAYQEENQQESSKAA